MQQSLRGGVELSRNIDKPILPNNNTLIYQVRRQIRRLDWQASSYLVDWTPAEIQETPVSQFTSSGSAFRSLDEAADRLHILGAQIMRLRNTEKQTPQTPSSINDILFWQLQTWLRLFDIMLRQGSSDNIDSQASRLISLLRVQHTAITILTYCCLAGKWTTTTSCPSSGKA